MRPSRVLEHQQRLKKKLERIEGLRVRRLVRLESLKGLEGFQGLPVEGWKVRRFLEFQGWRI